MFSSKFHSKCRTRDLVRRRRWHRKMVQTDPTAPAVFYISEEVREQVSSIRYSSSGSSLVIIKNHSVTELGSNLKLAWTLTLSPRKQPTFPNATTGFPAN